MLASIRFVARPTPLRKSFARVSPSGRLIPAFISFAADALVAMRSDYYAHFVRHVKARHCKISKGYTSANAIKFAQRAGTNLVCAIFAGQFRDGLKNVRNQRPVDLRLGGNI